MLKYLIVWREYNNGATPQYEEKNNLNDCINWIADNRHRIASYNIYRSIQHD